MSTLLLTLGQARHCKHTLTHLLHHHGQRQQSGPQTRGPLLHSQQRFLRDVSNLHPVSCVLCLCV